MICEKFIRNKLIRTNMRERRKGVRGHEGRMEGMRGRKRGEGRGYVGVRFVKCYYKNIGLGIVPLFGAKIRKSIVRWSGRYRSA